MSTSTHVETLLKQRYYLPNETWPELVQRVVEAVCVNATPNYRARMLHLIGTRAFLPNSPCLVNAGKPNAGYFACFVTGPGQDDLTVHLETLTDIAQVAKAGGGAGFSGANIRPKNSPVAGSTHGYAYGPNAFALQVNNYMQMMTQAGFRRMALMYTLPSDHPDLVEFIGLKQSGDESRGALFNQSIIAKDNWLHKATTDPTSTEGVLLKQLARNAWNNGEPGLLFYDTINKNTPYKTCDCPPIVATNPCGEQPLPEYGSCNLGSINIAHQMFYNAAGEFDFDVLAKVAGDAAQFLDDVGVVNNFPNAKFAAWYADHRPIGLGIMGYADALLQLGLTYGSKNALNFADKVMRVIYHAALQKSLELGQIRGIPAHCTAVGRRNITLLTIAPTGSISFIAECSSSIEPIFAPTFTRQDERGERYTFDVATAALPHFRSAINTDPTKVVPWQAHVETQLVFQKWVDSGVSKTINMPNEATTDDVYNAMVAAWQGGAKGITVYRNGSRQSEVLTTGKAYTKRPKQLPADIYRVKINGDRWLLLVGLLNNQPYELFAVKTDVPDQTAAGHIEKIAPKVYNLVTSSYTLADITKLNSAEEQALTRLISLHLRQKTPLHFIVEQLTKSEASIVSFAKAVNRVLANYTTQSNIKCSDCSSKNLISESGCLKCLDCGSSKCG